MSDQPRQADRRSGAPTAASSYSVPVPSNDESTPLAAAAQEHVSLLRRATAVSTFDRPVNTRVFVVANQKGGVGKTTTTVNVAAALAQKGLRVLVVDLDPQGNASTALNIPHSEGTPGVYEAIVEGTDLHELVQPCPDIEGLTVLPASIDLAGAEIELVSLVARESRLDRALQSYLRAREQAGDRIDYVLIDCPPSLGLLTVNAMVAGREVLIPIQCEYYALEGLGQLVRNIDLIRSHLNPKLEITTILLTMFDGRTRLSAGVAQEVRSHFGDIVISTPIPRSVRISEAPSYQQSVITYDSTSSGALSYLEAAREIAVAGTKAR
ncbi:AAA family ATPase [Aeromicrobium sp. SMF47]|uniref:AAA family ATPase n=1 Tax=Aeromicrobium yanjiei TaxID=2662028 RepID=A0A5Q2MMS6_9ACTN|nr:MULTISPECIES: AAA family ATPase [Aeromicrobium]MRJ75659.1 AAA family ATPase [Aeromicrobium yanjiei]MRK00004.1 AAA family ATPase [Aeromicrobium sp. S22]QGG43083.1 AAA family ATPase [Aeromicrobium yanjiei]